MCFRSLDPLSTRAASAQGINKDGIFAVAIRKSGSRIKVVRGRRKEYVQSICIRGSRSVIRESRASSTGQTKSWFWSDLPDGVSWRRQEYSAGYRRTRCITSFCISDVTRSVSYYNSTVKARVLFLVFFFFSLFFFFFAKLFWETKGIKTEEI